MVSVSGFRGRVGEALTPELVAGVASAFGAFLSADGDEGPILLGRDSRTSGPLLARAASAGLESVGREVVDLGMVATPTLLLEVESSGAAGGIVVTASHNPSEWNALKLAGGDGMFLDAERMSRFLRALREESPPRAPWDELGRRREDPGATTRHVEAILGLPHVDVAGLRDRGFHVVVDCVHGAGGVLIPPLLHALGCRVEWLGGEPDGRFPRDPEPRGDNLGELEERIRRTGAELGFAVDPDVDRLSLVDGQGRALGEDLTLALAAAAVLQHQQGPVVTNLSTSRVVEDVARHHGVPLVRSPVGEINVARKMQEVRAVVGGEGNGGVILPELHGTRDAAAGMALVLQHLLETGRDLRSAADRWPGYEIVKEKRAFPRELLSQAYRLLRAGPGADAEADEQDGLRLDWPEAGAWLHVRPSGTEPVVRLIAEAPSGDQARDLVEEAGRVLESAVEEEP